MKDKATVNKEPNWIYDYIFVDGFRTNENQFNWWYFITIWTGDKEYWSNLSIFKHWKKLN